LRNIAKDDGYGAQSDRGSDEKKQVSVELLETEIPALKCHTAATFVQAIILVRSALSGERDIALP
jgi:hypothetical protein